MVSPSMSPSTFIYFAGLPPELRNQIWLNALPEEHAGPALFSYKPPCWELCHLSEYDDSIDPDDEDEIGMTFRHDLLGGIQVDMPLAFVSRESRAIATGWVSKQGMELKYCPYIQRAAAVRLFDPTRDALYVSQDKMSSFHQEPNDRLFQPDMFNRSCTTGGALTNIHRIAMTKSAFEGEAWTLAETFDWFPRLTELWIIVRAPPDLDDGDETVQQRWEPVGLQGASYSYSLQHGDFLFHRGELVCDEGAYAQIEAASSDLHQWIFQCGIPNFAVRPLLVARK